MYTTIAMVYNSYEHFDLVDPRLSSPNPLACINRGEDREFFVLLTNDREGIDQVIPVVSVCRRLANALISSEVGRGSHKMQAKGITGSIDSCRALSCHHLSQSSHTIHSIARVSSSLSDMSEPLSSTLIPDGNQVNAAGSGNTVLQAWSNGLLDNQAWITSKCSQLNS
ncbi:uncharacterized protein LOC111316543 [Durio zibethinus]|uniref:Uncharacterized protein LOC111316543 n=1 Tax=Durio zibethinus TaxID=66656 RepID=A0A6P6BAX4_DURZI|nr:uncharacterized protein LOC111316543 [Durio zibethinus]